MRNKVVPTVVLVGTLALVASFGVTYAYLVARDRAVNEFTVGETTIEVVEEFSPPEKLAPGVTFDKKPSVKNTGNLPCFVRMRADFSTSVAEELCEPLDVDGDHWEYHPEDGYYYYVGVLEVGSQTEPLFTKVELRDGILESEVVDFDILVYAESCEQGDRNPEDYTKVWN